MGLLRGQVGDGELLWSGLLFSPLSSMKELGWICLPESSRFPKMKLKEELLISPLLWLPQVPGISPEPENTG